MTTPHSAGPDLQDRPLLVVHRIEVDRVFIARCGALAGARRWDAALGQWLQDTARYSLPASPGDGEVLCCACVAQ